jgi:cold shock CspA family protein
MKNFRDSWATDPEGKRFVFTVEMQRQLSEAGLPVTPESIPLLKKKPSAPPPPPPPPAPTFTPPKSTKPAGAEPHFTAKDDPEEIQIDPHTGKYIGRVKWYNPLKSIGQIARGAGESMVFHKKNVLCRLEDLTAGQWVLYDVEEGPKGFEAGEVELYQP